MTITAAYSQDVKEFMMSGHAYESFKYLKTNKHIGLLDIHDQQKMYEEAVAQLASRKEFDVVHAHDWLTFRAAYEA